MIRFNKCKFSVISESNSRESHAQWKPDIKLKYKFVSGNQFSKQIYLIADHKLLQSPDELFDAYIATLCEILLYKRFLVYNHLNHAMSQANL